MRLPAVSTWSRSWRRQKRSHGGRGRSAERSRLTGWRTKAPNHAKREHMAEGESTARPVLSPVRCSGLLAGLPAWLAPHIQLLLSTSFLCSPFRLTFARHLFASQDQDRIRWLVGNPPSPFLHLLALYNTAGLAAKNSLLFLGLDQSLY
jgi:hypothetical protein